jgi:hypothetical protein
MHNWSTNLAELKKDKKQYAIWQLEQMVNFGLEGKKINRKKIKKYWPELVIDENKKKYLAKLLWSKQS